MNSSPSSNANSNAGGVDDLEFPVDPAYAPLPPAISLGEAAVLIEELRAAFPQAMETAEQRLARKVTVEFVL